MNRPEPIKRTPNAFQDVIKNRSLWGRLQIRRTSQLVWRSAPLWTMINGAFVLVEGLLPLLSLYLLKLIIDAFSEGIGEKNPDAFIDAAWLIAALAGVSTIAALFKAFGRLVIEAHVEAVTDHVQTILQTKSVEVDLESYESPEYHDLLQQVQSQATFRPARIARGVFVGARSLITLFALASFLFAFSWRLGIILLLFAMPGVVVRLKYAHRLVEWHGRQSSIRRFSGYLHGLLAGSTFAKEVRLFGLGDILRERACLQRQEMRAERLHLETHRSLIELIPNLSAVIALFLSFWLIARKAMLGGITLGSIVVYYQAFQRCQSALSEFLTSIVNYYEDSVFLGIFYRYLDIVPKIVDPPEPRVIPTKLRIGIALEGVCFKYPGANRDVLKDISLLIPPGEIIALVGENGAGKSTIAKLICRLYDPTQGRITLDGIDIRDFVVEDYRRMIGVVFQDFNVYNLTARENIWFGNVTQPKDDPSISEAAIKAGIHETIAGLTNGYDTILGREFHTGEQLSAGQWQRLALARALLRDSQIMILDEPTSAMDPKAEHELYKTIRTITAGRMTLLISHRLSTVTMADRICVLDHGRIVEVGSHKELQNVGGIYADLFERQSQAYR